MDDEILKTVHSLFGPGVNVVDCEKVSTVAQEEVLLINGIPLKLDGMSFDDATAIKTAFREGQMPSVDLLNELLTHAGIINQSVQLETSLSVKSSLVTKEEVLVSKHGKILDERTTETKEDYVLKSNTIEHFQPICKKKLENSTKNKLEALNPSTSKSSVELDDGAYYSSGNSFIQKYPTNETFSNCSTYGISKLSDDGIKKSIGNISGLNESPTILKNFSFDDSGHDDTLLSTASEYPAIGIEIASSHLTQSKDNLSKKNIDAESSVVEKQILNTQVLTFNNGRLVSGSMENIIKHWCRNGYTVDENFLITFVLCCRKCYSPFEMLTICFKTWEDQQGREFDTHKVGNQGLQLLHQWYMILPHDFQDNVFLEEIKKWIKLSVVANKTFNAEALELAQKIATQYESTVNNLEEFLLNFTIPVGSLPSALPEGTREENSSNKNSVSQKSVDITLKKHIIMQFNSNPIDLVHQLTAAEFDYMSKIEMEALIYYVDESFLQSDLATCIDRSELSALSSHILSYKNWFNHLKRFVIMEIVKTVKKKPRVLVVDLWIDVACELFKLGNYNSLMAILVALQSPAVSRLKKTWAKVQVAKYSVLRNQMDSGADFASYRILFNMKSASRTADDSKVETDFILVPYFDLFLRDLKHLMEIYSNLPNGLVNFDECFAFAKLLKEFNTWRNSQCPYERNSLLQSCIVLNSDCDEDTSLKQSFLCESPASEVERSTLKALKSSSK